MADVRLRPASALRLPHPLAFRGARGATLTRERLVLSGILVLAASLRLIDIGGLSLWLDEVSSVHFARLSWSRVAGFEGAYDTHPPLYYLLAKAASLGLPEQVAGRIISAIAGVLTVWLVFLLASRLGPRISALSAALVVTVSPLHIWYSREARMYALTVLLVVACYLAAVVFWQERGWRWAVALSVTALLAAYTDYSGLFALAPLGLIILWRFVRSPRRGWPLAVAVLIAGIGYLPWLSQISQTIDEVGTNRDFLQLTSGNLIAALQAVVGLNGQMSYYWGSPATPVTILPILPLLAGALALPVLAGALLALPRQAALAALVGSALWLGTMTTTALVSSISPAFADRTILASVPGWAILVSLIPFVRLPCGSRIAAILLLVLSVTTSTITSASVLEDGQKQDYRGFTAELAQTEQTGLPMIVPEGFTRTAISIYQPDLAVQDVRRDALPEGIWLAGGQFDDLDEARSILSGTGYHRAYDRDQDGLSLELWVASDAVMGLPVDVDASFAHLAGQTPHPSWRLEGPAARIVAPSSQAPSLSIDASVDGSADQSFAALDLDATAGTLYLATVAAHRPVGEAIPMVSLTCHATDGRGLKTSTIATEPGEPLFQTAVLCPSLTSSLSISLRATGEGHVLFDEVLLRQLPVNGGAD